MRHPRLLATAGAVLLGLLDSACPPKAVVPPMAAAGCQNDDDCKQPPSAGGVCVRGSCQQCREESQCGASESCDAGRCAAKRCACADGELCRDGACVPDTTLAARPMSLPQLCEQLVAADGTLALPEVRFGFDDWSLDGEAQAGLRAVADCLSQIPEVAIVLEGHCDERGTQEYNLALGERRAAAVRTYLRNLGLEEARLRTLSKGKNEPLCREESDSCHARNRRVEAQRAADESRVAGTPR